MEVYKSILSNIIGINPPSKYDQTRIFNRFPEVINSTGFNIFEYQKVFDDEKTNELIRKGQTIGCFYIESPGMRSLLQKLDCHSFEMLTAASSVIRPGVAESGMMKEFIARHRDPTRRRYIIPEMEQYLHETYGVMIYQEDVIKIAHHIAGMTLDEADLLRRAMSGRMRSHSAMKIIKDRFFECCEDKNLSDEMSERLWVEIESFAGYAFCKAHSASFALLSYQVAYVKANYPAEFMAGVLNNGGGYYSSAVYISECRRMGLKLILPNINKSEYEYRAVKDDEIQIGLMAIAVLEVEEVKFIVKERKLRGKYKSMQDLLQRTALRFEQMEALILCGALDCFHQPRPILLRLLDTYFFQKKFINTGNMDFFAGNISSFQKEVITDYEFNLKDKCTNERAILGYMVSEHPLTLFKEREDKEIITAARMQKYHNKKIKIMGWYMASKRMMTSKGGIMKFLSLEDTTGTFEAVLFPEAYAKYADLTELMGPYIIEGKVDSYNGNNIIVDKLTVLSREKARSATQKEKTNTNFFGDAERPMRDDEIYHFNSVEKERLSKAYI